MAVPSKQLEDRARQWKVTIDEILETPGSVLGFGMCRGSRVVLKVIKQQGDEYLSGKVLKAFDGHGTVRVLEFESGAVLLERLDPGEPLVKLVRQHQDEKATEILGELINQISRRTAPDHCPTLHDWSRGFDRYLQTGDTQLPFQLVVEAREWYQRLVRSQQKCMLLHGDLQHYNVLFDNKRGWVAIDPKGVIGELEYEIGALLRNPIELPELVSANLEKRLGVLTKRLNLDYERSVGWSFSQAVLSAIWEVEDGHQIQPVNSALKLAYALKPLLN